MWFLQLSSRRRLTVLGRCWLWLVAMLCAASPDQAFAGSAVDSIDLLLLDALSALRRDPWLGIFAWITDLGAYPALSTAAVVGLTLFWASGQRRLLLAFAITIIGSQATLWLAKFGFNRTRPEFLTDVTASSASFPSGHTTGAIAIYGFLAFAAAHLLPGHGARALVTVAAATIIALVAFSRTVLHVHYPSDVLAGLVLGGLWLMAGVAVVRWRAGDAGHKRKSS